MDSYGVIGAGGLGREVMPLLRRMVRSKKNANVFFVVEDEYATDSTAINGHEVISLTHFLNLPGKKFFTIAIADSRVRERICNSISTEDASPISLFSETFVSLDSNEIGTGALFANFSHVTSNATIGKQFQCNIYSYVGHDVVIGDYVTFAPGVKCNGHVVIEDHAYIGTGAIIKDGTDRPMRIGKGAVIGMGAVVTKSVPPGAVVVGNPASPINKKS